MCRVGSSPRPLRAWPRFGASKSHILLRKTQCLEMFAPDMFSNMRTALSLQLQASTERSIAAKAQSRELQTECTSLERKRDTSLARLRRIEVSVLS